MPRQLTSNRRRPRKVNLPKSPKPVGKDAKRAEQGKELQGRVLIPKYRLALAFAPVPAALNEQLGLKWRGVARRASWGGRAGRKRLASSVNDILLAIGDKRLKKYGDAVEGLNASEGKEISLTLVRDGKTITVSVVPTKHRRGDEKVRVSLRPLSVASGPRPTKTALVMV